MTYPIPKPREKSRWSNLSQGSLPLALARYLPHKRLKVVLTQDAEQALRLQTAWRFFRPHDTAVFLPDWETLPYERFSPHQDLVSERLSALWQIKSGAADVLFVPVATAMQKLPPVPFLAGRTFWLKTGQTLDIGRLKTDLVDAGYNHVSHVVAAGEFAVRGGIVDLFPMGSEMPYRIDLFDDEIDSIKTFDTDTQRTISPVSEIRLLPAHEFPTDSEAQKIFRSRFREEVDGNPNDAAVYKAVSNGHFGAGVEYYLPLFFENELETLFDYIGEDALFVSLGDVHAEANRFWSDVKSRYAMAQGDETYPPLLPQHLYLSADVFAGRLKNYGQVLPDVSGKEHTLPDLAVNRQSDEPLIRQQPAPSPVGEGWGEGKAVAAQSAIAVITESDLYQYVARSRVHNRRKKHAAVSDGLLRDLAEINIGDPVVHEEHGIGRYMGLITMDLGGETNEMMLLEYAGEAQLYVPVSQLHLISRYSGQAHENVALHKLGSGAWNKAKRKAAEKARDTAAELLNLYAQRAAQSGHKFEINELDYQAFADGFGYEETEDQAAAIAAVIKDLTQAKPMDRLVCGDVGFGKTE
ncbi:CarD family transcriptional regulator, partial [Neisseria meningitidis]|uniref:CarD family transcriptional regulator n=1 Tax=Neisseria meningitidis TaxID=487 RepID=UPI0023BA27A0